MTTTEGVSRRAFVKSAGGLVIGFSFVGALAGTDADGLCALVQLGQHVEIGRQNAFDFTGPDSGKRRNNERVEFR